MRDLSFETFFLQETHSTRESQQMWSNEWGYKIYFCHGKSNSGRVCILFKPSCGITVHSMHRDEDGRILVLIVSYENMKFTIANIYGPNKDGSELFEGLHALFKSVW